MLNFNRERCKKMLKKLSSHFGIQAPVLIWDSKLSKYGAAYRNLNIIELGPIPKLAMVTYETVLLHEFSHRLSLSIRHGVKFRYALLRVVKFWYGDTDKYDWESDYKCVAKWYLNRKRNVELT